MSGNFGDVYAYDARVVDVKPTRSGAIQISFATLGIRKCAMYTSLAPDYSMLAVLIAVILVHHQQSALKSMTTILRQSSSHEEGVSTHPYKRHSVTPAKNTQECSQQAPTSDSVILFPHTSSLQYFSLYRPYAEHRYSVSVCSPNHSRQREHNMRSKLVIDNCTN